MILAKRLINCIKTLALMPISNKTMYIFFGFFGLVWFGIMAYLFYRYATSPGFGGAGITYLPS